MIWIAICFFVAGMVLFTIGMFKEGKTYGSSSYQGYPHLILPGIALILAGIGLFMLWSVSMGNEEGTISGRQRELYLLTQPLLQTTEGLKVVQQMPDLVILEWQSSSEENGNFVVLLHVGREKTEERYPLPGEVVQATQVETSKVRIFVPREVINVVQQQWLEKNQQPKKN